LYEPLLVETKAVNFSERFDIHRIVADCQAAMHYVELDVGDAYGNDFLTQLHRYLF